MSVSYTHFLIPRACDYRPSPEAISQFLNGLIAGGAVAADFSIDFSKVAKNPGRVRRGRNPATGESIEMPLPTRANAPPQRLSDTLQLSALAKDEPEYDISIVSQGAPAAPPLDMGYVEGAQWKRMNGAYHQRIVCRVRKDIVRLFTMQSEDELTRPPDFASYRPRFNEDCSPEEHSGLFLHPQIGVIRIENAGCASFWVQFEFGKLIFPLAKDGKVDLLSESLVREATNAFVTEFVQACNWG
jgi:hypothetical protein